MPDLVAAGASVVITGRRESVSQESVASLGERASYISAGVTRADAARELVAEVVARHGTLTILVNNAGVHLKKPLEETEVAVLPHVKILP